MIVDEKVSTQSQNEELACQIARWEAMAREMEQINAPSYLPVVSMRELFETVYPSKSPIIDGLLYTCTYLIAGAPKIGKSFLVAQIAYHVSVGQHLWGYPIHKGTALYLALEDDHQRLQQRMSRMFGVEDNENLFFSTCSKTLGGGLEEQINAFIQEHPNTRLVIIDTLQKVRALSGDSYSYANDYEVVSNLKKLADRRNVCLLIVHHTRKQKANDKFDMISGTTGLLGAADGAFILQKEKRTDHTATLEVTGRDQQEQKLYLVRNEENLTWCLDHAETELWKEPPDPLLEKVASLLTEESAEWEGRASDLVEALQVDIQPNTLTKRLNIKAGMLKDDFHVLYSSKRTRNGSYIRLKKLGQEM